MSYVLTVDKAAFSYREKRVLDEVSFSIKKNSFNILLGVNGAGKTTLFSLITGLYSANKGKVRIFDYDIAQQPMMALSKLGVVFQDNTLDNSLTIRQNIRYYAALHGLTVRAADQYLEQRILKHLPDVKPTQKVSALSGGQKRIIELIRALMTSPKLLLLDEPTTGLDIKNRHDFIHLTRNLCRTEKIGVLWATHLVDEVDENDNLIILNQGKIVADNQVKALINQTGKQSIQTIFQHFTQIEEPAVL